MRPISTTALIVLALLLGGPSAVMIQTAAAAEAEVKRAPDLADQLTGTYEGDVISDARGSSRSGVTITVTRTGKNMIQVASDYARIPTVSIRLTKAMDSIIAADGPYVVVVNTAADAARMDLTIDDASWSGRKVGAP
ncbi:hypothetical protein ACFB49_02190 [Sphingomonas sp. DBB INV C78]|uniref:hypothetical protein n=1 Tax=Sphingomonas sp. DBB INV C78 TaxID=3349434 RepID=UPI0036D3A5AE